MEYAFEGNNKRKVVFIGDNAQLPPIGMNFSPALDKTYLQENYKITIAKSQMSQVVRQKHESGILNTATALRKSMEDSSFNHFSIQ